jgi:hypothetical protein
VDARQILDSMTEKLEAWRAIKRVPLVDRVELAESEDSQNLSISKACIWVKDIGRTTVSADELLLEPFTSRKSEDSSNIRILG